MNEAHAEEHNIFIAADGTIRFIWDDRLQPLCSEGVSRVRRVASVEPSAFSGGWTVDLSPIGGGFYGPYELRSCALAHERAVVTGRLVCGVIA